MGFRNPSSPIESEGWSISLVSNFFTGPQRKSPTEAGRLMAKYGPKLIEEIEHFAEILRAAGKQDGIH